MDDQENHRTMSLVPYVPAESREIVLYVLKRWFNRLLLMSSCSRHGSAVVVFDQHSKQLSLRDASHSTTVESACPFCHRPYREPSPHEPDDQDEHSHAGLQEPDGGFVNPAYFQMLQRSRPGSAETSRPPSPHKQLAAPAIRGIRSEPHVSDEEELFDSSPPPLPTQQHQGISARAFSPGYFKSFFVEERELGRGGKGVVLLVRHVLDGVNLGRFACKRVPVGDDHEWLEKVLIEVQLLQNLSHQNLVSYRHVWLEDFQITNFGPSVPCAFILQQYCNSGDLHNYILDGAKSTVTKEQLKERMRRRSKGQMEDPQELNGPRRLHFEEIIGFFKDITSGLNFLHANGYVHRDLKPSNCLLHNTGREMRVLVSDFGEMQAANAVRKSTGATGTISYCAPEVLRQETPGGAFGNFTTKSDIFSLGMIVYFMCFARLPYVYADGIDEEKEDLDQLRIEITTWAGFDDARRVRTDLPDRLYRSLKRLLALRPDDRPGTEEILQALKSPSLLDEFNDFASPTGLNEFVPRISRVDTPSPSPGQTHRKRSSVHFAKPGRSNLGSSSSILERSPSPGTSIHHKPTVRTPSPEEAAVTLRSRKIELPPPRNSSIDLSPPRNSSTGSVTSPRLMLPPTQSPRFSTYAITSNPRYVGAIKVSLFFIKVFSLFGTCHPFAANPWVAYPLLGFALYDLLSVALTNQGGYIGVGGLKKSMMFLALHGLLVVMLRRWDRLCWGSSVPWVEV